ncbi:unnamed protein product [Mytilus edulis]|uniref:Uncharacterized protein n=1 Tax=Mytilus edulis TaxID=6550 RepID=A0A8S3TF21_MYTED|nr:unnamed protein product [Mytilus edulis]
MAVVADIQEIIKSTKLKRSKNARSVMNSVTASISGENLANSRGKIKLCKNLGLPARRVAGGQRIRSRILKSESSAWALTQQKTRKDSISEETKKTVYNFWLSDGISHPTGNKSDIKRERLGPNLYTSHMTHVLEKTQTDAYLDFVAKYPEIKIGQRAFEKLRPFFVRPASEKDRNTCCCRYHVEANLVFKACMKFRKSCDRETDSQESDYPVFEKMSDLIHITLCPKVNGFIEKIVLSENVAFADTCNEIIVSDLSCYTCDQCILGNYLNCLNVENTGVKKTIKPREITQTSNEEEVAQDTDILSEDISDLVSINSVVAVKTDDDNFDYYLMKISKGSHVLNSAESDSWGATYPLIRGFPGSLL